MISSGMKNKQLYYSLGLISLVACFFLIYHGTPAYFRAQLPAKYKNYPALSEKMTARHHTVKQLFAGTPLSIYYHYLMHVVVISKSVKIPTTGLVPSFEQTYYRLDENGKLLDSLRNPDVGDEWGEWFGGHLLHNNYYTDYPTTGSNQPIAYVERNKERSMPMDALLALLDSLGATAEEADRRYFNDVASYFYTVNNQVHRVYVPTDTVISIERKRSTVFVSYPPIADELPVTGSYAMQNPNALMQMDYFLKQSYNGTHYPPFLIPDPVARPSRWEGTGYYSIRYPDDTLCFKYPVNYYPDDTPGRHPMHYYANRMSVPYYMTNLSGKLDYFCNPQLSFQLLTIGYGTFDQHQMDGCYIVVKK